MAIDMDVAIGVGYGYRGGCNNRGWAWLMKWA